ncbi:hypothetical protein [Bordetella genomosp. 11]|uniref:Uncharacterized protein n=1 Tax=Bordetella genomosp. 11 TaxID=1416808 RepID=A0A261UPN8_9BORD|nr:hypothetical protein [Bordetella genomosp. 11]OZI62883.1 hypothetical protein CAL28_27555 [Bordetella genomosp. 11]
MAVRDVGPIGGVSYAAPAVDVGSAAPFRARAGRGKRLMRLARDIREAPSMRGKLSLLYARVRADSRVRELQRWSDIGRGAAVSHDDMRQLVDRVTGKCRGPVNSRVFLRIAERFCENSDTGQLAALRRRLATATQDPDDWLNGAPGNDAARRAWTTLSAMLDDELARRTLLMPLKQIARALSTPGDAHTLDLACARLGVSLSRVSDEGTVRGLLAAALPQLTHAEFRLLARHLAATHPSSEGSDTEHCAMARALRGRRASSQLWQQRLDLIGALQGAMRDAVGKRLDYFVDTTAKLIDFQLGQGRSSQEVYDLAFASLSKSLEDVGYTGVLVPDSNALAPRLIAAALMAKPLKDVLAFAGKLSIQTLGTLLHAMEDARADYADAAWLIRGMRDDRVRRYRDELTGCLGNLRRCTEDGGRWSIVRALEALGTALQAWESDGPCAGQPIPQPLRQDLRMAVRLAVPRIVGEAGRRAEALDLDSIRMLSDEEIRCLRRHESVLKQYGLRLDRGALETLARERAPYVAESIEHLAAVADALSRYDARPDLTIRALRDGAASLALACAQYGCFVDLGSDGIAKLCSEIAGAAWHGFLERHPARRADASAAMAKLGALLANGLSDAASCLVPDVGDRFPGDDEPLSHPAPHVAWRLRLASRLMEAMVIASLPEDDDAARAAAGAGFVAHWAAGLEQLLPEHFGVRYDAASARAELVMAPAQLHAFAQELLRREMTVPALASLQIPGPDGPVAIDLDRQFVLDGIDRPTIVFSVTGVDRLGHYIPYTSSPRVPGGEASSEGVERALLAFHRLAGPDMPMLSTYMVQTVVAELLKGLWVLGPQAPIKLDDGSPVLPGGPGLIRTDLARLADGSYRLRIAVAWNELVSVCGFAGKGTKMDVAQSYAYMACDLHLTPAPEGGWHREVTRPAEVGYRFVPIIESDDED